MVFTLRTNKPPGQHRLEQFIAAVRAGERPTPEDETFLVNAFQQILDGEDAAKALQLKRKTRGRPEVSPGRDYRLARQVYIARRANPDGLVTEIFDLISKRNNVSRETVEKAYYKYRDQVEADERAMAKLLQELRASL